jgi:hypothetical protein
MLSAAGEQPHPDCVAAYAAQVFQRGRELGEHATLLPLVEDAIRGDPELVIYQAALTSMLAEMGDLARAGDLLGALAGPGLPAVRRDQERPATLALLAETAATLGDAERSRWLLDELQPYAGRMLIVQSAVVAVGAADRFIGMLAATVGDGELATRSFEQARALESAMDATAHVARTELWQARALRRRGLETEAAAVAADGLTIATELRMTLLADQLLAIAGAPA